MFLFRKIVSLITTYLQKKSIQDSSLLNNIYKWVKFANLLN